MVSIDMLIDWISISIQQISWFQSHVKVILQELICIIRCFQTIKGITENTDASFKILFGQSKNLHVFFAFELGMNFTDRS